MTGSWCSLAGQLLSELDSAMTEQVQPPARGLPPQLVVLGATS